MVFGRSMVVGGLIEYVFYWTGEPGQAFGLVVVYVCLP